MKVAEFVARSLSSRGVVAAWGLPGAESNAVTAALKGAEIRYVQMRSDAAALFAAEASAQLSGGPGLAVGPKGRLVAGLSSGIVDRAAVFGWCTDDVRDTPWPVYRPWPTEVRPVLRTALAAQRMGRASPVALALPIDVSEGEILDSGDIVDIVAGSVAIEKMLVEKVRRFKRPMIVVGFAGRRSGVGKLADVLQAPVFTTARAKGAVPEETGLSAGAVGTHAAVDALHRAFLGRADGLIFVGFDPSEVASHFRNAFDPTSEVIVLDEVVPTDLGVRIDNLVIGPLPALMASLLDGLNSGPVPGGASEWRAEDAAGHRKRWQSLLEEKGFGVLQAVKAVRFSVGGGDAGSIDLPARGAATHVWRCDRPDRLLQSDARVPGYGIPSALAVVTAARRCVAVLDERTAQQQIGELATSIEANLPIVVVVLVDSEKPLVDWPAVGRAFGGEGVTATTSYEVSQAVRDGLYAEEPKTRVIAVRMDHKSERRV